MPGTVLSAFMLRDPFQTSWARRILEFWVIWILDRRKSLHPGKAWGSLHHMDVSAANNLSFRIMFHPGWWVCVKSLTLHYHLRRQVVAPPLVYRPGSRGTGSLVLWPQSHRWNWKSRVPTKAIFPIVFHPSSWGS